MGTTQKVKNSQRLIPSQNMIFFLFIIYIYIQHLPNTIFYYIRPFPQCSQTHIYIEIVIIVQQIGQVFIYSVFLLCSIRCSKKIWIFTMRNTPEIPPTDWFFFFLFCFYFWSITTYKRSCRKYTKLCIFFIRLPP